FTIHPALTQAVAWIPGRNDVLLAIVVLSSFAYFIKYLQTGKKLFFVLHGLLFFVGLLTKETTIALPLLCFLYYALVMKKKIFSLPTIIYGVVWVLIAFSYFLMRANALSGTEQTL